MMTCCCARAQPLLMLLARNRKDRWAMSLMMDWVMIMIMIPRGSRLMRKRVARAIMRLICVLSGWQSLLHSFEEHRDRRGELHYGSGGC